MKKYSLIIMALGALVLTSCILKKREGVDLSGGKDVQKEVPVENFTELTMSGGFDVDYVQGDTCRVVLSGSQKLVDLVKVEQQGDVLNIRFDSKSRLRNLFTLRNMKLKVTVICPELKAVTSAGACDFDAKEPVVGHTMLFDISGAGDIDVKHLTCDSLGVMINGAGDLELGLHKVGYTRVQISGAGDADIDFDDCGEALCEVSGAGDIKLSGRLRKLHKSVSGAGHIDTDRLDVEEK